MQPSAFFLSRVLLLGFGKLLSIKKKCHCRFVVTCLGFTTNCQNMSRSKSLPPDIHPLFFIFIFFTCHDPHSSTSMYVYIIASVHDETSRHVRSYSHTQSGVIQRLAQTRAKKMTSQFPLSFNLHSFPSPDLNVKFNVLSLFLRRMYRW